MSEAPSNNKDKALLNYKKSRDRAMSVLYSLMNVGGIFEMEALNKLSSGWEKKDVTEEEWKRFEGIVTEIAWHFCDAEDDLNNKDEFW